MTEHNRPPQWRVVLDTIAVVLMIAVSAALLWAILVGRDTTTDTVETSTVQTPPKLPVLPAPISIADAASKGSVSAPVVILEYSDFQCPSCGRFARDTLPALVREFVETGKVRFVFRHFPVPQTHPLATAAAEAAECARREGKFWEFHDVLFQKGQSLDVDSLHRHAKAIGMDSPRFTSCLKNDPGAQVVSDVEQGRALKFRGTPAFFIGTLGSDGRLQVSRTISGAARIETFRAAINDALPAATASR